MFSRLYGAIVNARNALYERGVFKSHSLGAKTISIGNITVGGTGKTPLVAFVAEILAESGERVCILTRGYGRENPKTRVLVSGGEQILANAKQAGDEPFELARKLAGKAIIVADANRASAGKWARETFGITAFVLDDAFQHRRVRRDTDIVCIDATNPFGNEKLLPSGILREPLTSLARASAIVITRANLVNNIVQLKVQIAEYNSHCPIFVSENRISKFIELKEFHSDTLIQQTGTSDKSLTGKRALAFCALGNPANFFSQLERGNFNLVATEKFPDHHFYEERDMEKLSEKAKQTGAEFLLTTAKDAVKLKDLKIDAPCLVVVSEMIFGAENDFRDLILKTLD